jgi:hypothetical protein
MRWTGVLTPTETGVHRFTVSGEGGYRVIVDGKTVVDAWTRAKDSAPDGEVALTAGKASAIVVEANQSGERGDLRLQWSRPSRGADAAVAAAKGADLVVFVGGLTAKLEGEEMSVRAPGFVGGDRTSLDLPAPQEGLLERLNATGKPVVLVLMNGSALSVNWADAHLPAIVEAWYPGGEGGRAVAGLLAGDFSPAGRLPLTFYRSADQLPAFKDYGMAGRTYRYFGGEALYPFGHGLSYTRFAYGQPVLERRRQGGRGPGRQRRRHQQRRARRRRGGAALRVARRARRAGAVAARLPARPPEGRRDASGELPARRRGDERGGGRRDAVDRGRAGQAVDRRRPAGGAAGAGESGRRRGAVRGDGEQGVAN